MKSILRVYSRLVLFSLPLFFLPLIIDGYSTGKNLWLLASAGLGVILWIVDLLTNKEEKIVIGKGFGWSIGVIISVLIAWFGLSSGGKMASVVNGVGVGTWIGLAIWGFLWTQIADSEEKDKQLNWLTISGVLVALISLILFVIPEAKLPINIPKENPVLTIGNGWSLTGSILAEVIFLFFLVVSIIKKLTDRLREGKGYWIEGGILMILILAWLVDVYRIFKIGWLVLDMNSAWVIAVETFKRNPLFGIGIGNYLQAFNMFRPATFNNGLLWGSSFSLANMGLLHIWTEIGTVGLGLVIMGLWKSIKNSQGFDKWRIIIAVGLVLLLPLNIISLMLLVWVLVGSNQKKLVGIGLRLGEKGINAGPWIVSALAFGLVIWGGWWLVNIFRGEISFRKSLVAMSRNDAEATYNAQIKAIEANKFMGEYRRVHSQTALTIAVNILKKEALSEEDKNQASQLIQRSVEQAKAAIALDSLNASYWSNLAMIYRNIIGVVDGSADWSVQAYQQAAVFDPVNPLLKLDLGGLFFAAQRYDDADKMFEQAVTAKSNYANGWYNWAYTAKQLNKLGDAVARLQQAVSLVPADTADFEKANKELADWKKEYEKATKTQPSATAPTATPSPELLKPPEILPTANPQERVELPAQEMEPPTGPSLVPTEGQ